MFIISCEVVRRFMLSSPVTWNSNPTAANDNIKHCACYDLVSGEAEGGQEESLAYEYILKTSGRQHVVTSAGFCVKPFCI